MKAFFFKRIFIVTMVAMALVSLAFLLVRKETAPMVSGLEGLLILYCGAAFLWAKSQRIDSVVIVRTGIGLYVALSFAYVIMYKHANTLDFLLIYKSYIYLFFLTFLADKRLMTAKGVLNFYTFLLGAFFIKYLLALVLHTDDRPVVYEENNFELMLLYSLYLVRFSITRKKAFFVLGLVGVITILSLSRSSLLMYSVLVFYVFYTSFPRTWVYVIPVALVVMGAVIYFIFSERSGSLEDIDRFKFMTIFWGEVKHWNLWHWLVGNERITPLSYYACDNMSYFTNLFSYSGDGTCYSVILHSFLFRVILDHGLLGLVLIIYATWLLMNKSGISRNVILVFLAIVLINGLSVSSFNNLFFAISMVFLMTTNMKFLQVPARVEKHDQNL
ncbi:hypothetical protein [Arcticibacter svalbardensis]|nr:hypothetical protein [Arcticibacter svalbardensis]